MKFKSVALFVLIFSTGVKCAPLTKADHFTAIGLAAICMTTPNAPGSVMLEAQDIGRAHVAELQKYGVEMGSETNAKIALAFAREKYNGRSDIRNPKGCLSELRKWGPTNGAPRV